MPLYIYLDYYLPDVVQWVTLMNNNFACRTEIFLLQKFHKAALANWKKNNIMLIFQWHLYIDIMETNIILITNMHGFSDDT